MRSPELTRAVFALLALVVMMSACTDSSLSEGEGAARATPTANEVAQAPTSPVPPVDDPTAVASPTDTPISESPATEATPSVEVESEPIIRDQEIDLVSSLLTNTAWSNPHLDRYWKSGLYEHTGQNPSSDCSGLRRGQKHLQQRFAEADFSWFERRIELEQEVVDFGDAGTASAHMEMFTEFGAQCQIAELHCSGCGIEDGSFDRTYAIRPWETGVAGVIAFEIERTDDGSLEWWARYQRDEVVTTLRLVRPVVDPWPERNEDLEAFDSTVALMASALDDAEVRPSAGPWPDPFVVDEFTIELVVVKEDDRDWAWIDYEGWDDTPRSYVAFDADGSIADSVNILLLHDPHDPEDVEYTLGDYSFFEHTTEVAGRQAIWEQWFDSEREISRGYQLVWDASPDRYGFMQSRTLTLDEMRSVAAELVVDGTSFEWPAPTKGMQPVATSVFTSEAEDFFDRPGRFAHYEIDWATDEDDSERADATIGFFPSLPDEITLLRSLAFTEEQVTVRGAVGYLLEIEPVSEYEDGVTYLAWQEDDATTAIAAIDDHQAASLLVQIAESFDHTRQYD